MTCLPSTIPQREAMRAGSIRKWRRMTNGCAERSTVTQSPSSPRCDHGDTHADVLDSCWGFIGDDDYAMSEGMAFVGWQIASALRIAS